MDSKVDTEKLGQAHDKAVAVIDKYAKSHHAAALMLGTLADAEIRMLHGETYDKALDGFVDPLLGRIRKLYATV